jgi:hypothetical protein
VSWLASFARLSGAALAGMSLCLAAAGAGAAEVPNSKPNPELHAAFNGVWLAERAMPRLLTAEGTAPPLRPEAKKLYEQRQAARKAGDTSFDRTTWCASPGIPRLMFVRHPFEIAVSQRRVAFLFSWSNWYRTVDMSGVKWPVDEEYSSVGVGMGRWEGNTLVIETTGLRSEPVLDREGLPQTAGLKLTERVRLLNENTLEVRFRVDDPETFTRPWNAVMTYRRQPDDAAEEFICLDEIKKGRPGLIEN